MLNAPKPLVPEPFEANVIVAVPLFAPALVVFTPTCNVLLLAPAPNNATAPLEVADPLAEMLASNFSEKPSLAAVLVSEIACVRPPPTC